MRRPVTGFIFTFLAFMLTWQVAATDAAPSMAQWNFAESGPFPLRDGWTVYRDRIVAPESLTNSLCANGADGEPVQLPDVWGPSLTMNLSTGHGKATYCTSIDLVDPSQLYSLQIGTLRSVSHVYAVTFQDGKAVAELLFKNGDLEPLDRQLVANPALPVIQLPSGSKSFTLVLQVSNYIHKQGGIVDVPTVDLRWRLSAAENRMTAIPSALVIVLILTGIATVIAGKGRHASRVHYYFAFLAFAAAFRATFVSDLIWDYLPSFSLARKYDFEYLTLPLVGLAYYGFIHGLLRPGKRVFMDYIMYPTLILSITFALVAAPFFQPGTITLLREFFQLMGLMIIIMMLYAVFVATFETPETRREAMGISFAAVIYAGFELASVYGVVPWHLEWSQFIIFLALIMHGHVFVIQARRMEKERDTLMARLADKNRDLQNRALALELSRQEAEKASQAKSQFLSNFSHELRTPLNAIIGFSDLMSRQLLGKIGSPLYVEYIKDIHASGTHLLALVDDILDLSRIEEGADVLKVAPVDLVSVAHETTAILHLLAKERSVALMVDSEQHVPRIMGDERRLRQILINLVNNAIKFNVEKGRVCISLHTSEDGIYVKVEDTGLGIAEADLPLVLARFGQVDAQRRSNGAGVGLGLPMCDALMRQHGGELTIASTLGEGTTVQLFFPAELIVTNHPNGESLLA